MVRSSFASPKQIVLKSFSCCVDLMGDVRNSTKKAFRPISSFCLFFLSSEFGRFSLMIKMLKKKKWKQLLFFFLSVFNNDLPSSSSLTHCLKMTKISHFWNLLINYVQCRFWRENSNLRINLARFARIVVKWDFIRIFQTMWSPF